MLVAVGGPNLVSGQGWDPAPLLLAAVLLLLLFGAGARLRVSTVFVAIAGGIAIDLLTDSLALSPIFALTPIVVVLVFVALRGTTVP